MQVEEKIMIYLDNASTTKPDSEVLSLYQEAQASMYFNSESLHIGGEMIKETLHSCRTYIQRYFNTTKEILFTTSGSHANLIAIQNYLASHEQGTVVVSPYEHPSIWAALAPYEPQITVVQMPLNDQAEIDIVALEQLLNQDTLLVIAQHVNSETGYILPIEAIAKLAHQYHIPFHVDGVQAVQKIERPSLDQICTSYSFSGHKFHGTKGSGVLAISHAYVRPLNPHYFHEQGTRNGTLDLPSILALTKALTLTSHFDHLQRLHHYAKQRAEMIGFTVLTFKQQAPHILGLMTPHFEGQWLMQSLSSRNICISTGTACGHGVLLSQGLIHKIQNDQLEPDQYIRISFSKETTIDEIDQCFSQIDHIFKGVPIHESS